MRRDGFHSLSAATPGWAYSRYSLYLLYWYKSTNTDAFIADQPQLQAVAAASLYLLYWYTSTNTDAALADQPQQQAVAAA
jgi:hypothetical protein